jgi:protein SCO1/2
MTRFVFTILVSISFLTAGCIGSDQEIDIFYGEDINPYLPANDFTLIDENGENFTLYELEGDVVVIAFLFTRCPDICPVVSANLAYVGQELGDLYGSEVHILTVTVDPWTDNSSVLNAYSDARGLDWPHLTADLEVIEPVWRNFAVGLATYDSDLDGDGVADGFDTCANTTANTSVDNEGCSESQKEPSQVQAMHHPLSYWVDHTTGTIIVDKQMNQRVWWGDTDWNAELVLEDIKLLLEE